MPIDERLRDSPPNNMEAGPSRRNGDGSARTRLKPRKSAESDVFDEFQNQGSTGRSPADATKQVSKGKPVSTTKPVIASKAYLAPPSSQPDEDIVRDKSLAALEQAMDEVIDEDSAAEGQPDTDEGELEQELLRHIARQERRADQTSRHANDSPQFASQASRRTISPPTVSQVPDTQAAPDIGPSQGPAGSPARLRNQDVELPVNTTGRILLDSAQVPGLPVRVNESSTRIQSSTISVAGASAQVTTTRTISEVILQTPTISESSAKKGQAAIVGASKPSELSDQERASSRVQTEQEKREELKRIVVGLVQEYDLNYKAMHRLIEECRKRYNYVNQALLRGMIEQALANAQE